MSIKFRGKILRGGSKLVLLQDMKVFKPYLQMAGDWAPIMGRYKAGDMFVVRGLYPEQFLLAKQEENDLHPSLTYPINELMFRYVDEKITLKKPVASKPVSKKKKDLSVEDAISLLRSNL